MVPDDLTDLLRRSTAGDRAAADALLAAVEAELHGMAESHMRRERTDHTLQATALVHEAWLRLVPLGTRVFADCAEFLRHAGRTMRNVLVDHARARATAKRGGVLTQLPFDVVLERYWPSPLCAEDVLDLHDALEATARTHPTSARVVELPVFAGLDTSETALALGLTEAKVTATFRKARTWLARRLGGST